MSRPPPRDRSGVPTGDDERRERKLRGEREKNAAVRASDNNPHPGVVKPGRQDDGRIAAEEHDLDMSGTPWADAPRPPVSCRGSRLAFPLLLVVVAGSSFQWAPGLYPPSGLDVARYPEMRDDYVRKAGRRCIKGFVEAHVHGLDIRSFPPWWRLGTDGWGVLVLAFFAAWNVRGYMPGMGVTPPDFWDSLPPLTRKEAKLLESASRDEAKRRAGWPFSLLPGTMCPANCGTDLSTLKPKPAAMAAGEEWVVFDHRAYDPARGGGPCRNSCNIRTSGAA